MSNLKFRFVFLKIFNFLFKTLVQKKNLSNFFAQRSLQILTGFENLLGIKNEFLKNFDNLFQN
jgi:hypothetical protein